MNKILIFAKKNISMILLMLVLVSLFLSIKSFLVARETRITTSTMSTNMLDIIKVQNYSMDKLYQLSRILTEKTKWDADVSKKIRELDFKLNQVTIVTNKPGN